MSLKQASNIIQMVDYTNEEKSNVSYFYILIEYCSSNLIFKSFIFDDQLLFLF